MIFSCLTQVLVIGSFAERIKLSAVLLFVTLWATFIYFSIAHMA